MITNFKRETKLGRFREHGENKFGTGEKNSIPSIAHENKKILGREEL